MEEHLAEQGAKRSAETPVEALDPEADTSAEGVPRMVAALATVDLYEEAWETEVNAEADENYDPADDAEGHVMLDDAADEKRVEGRRLGRLAELTKMEEFGLADCIPKRLALENGWRILKHRWADKERPHVWKAPPHLVENLGNTA